MAIYPVTWASRVKLESQQCPDIDGEYLNLGDLSKESDIGTYTVEPASISLAHILAGRAENEERLNFTQGDATTDAHRSVHLSVADDTLQVIVKRTDGTVRTFQMPVERECSASMIDAGAAWDGTTTLLASEVDRSSMKLGRAEDGAPAHAHESEHRLLHHLHPIFGIEGSALDQVSAIHTGGGIPRARGCNRIRNCHSVGR